MLNFKIPSVKEPFFQTILKVRISEVNYGNHLGHEEVVHYPQ